MKTGIAIAGCCVCRDIFNKDRSGEFQIDNFIQLNPVSCIHAGGGTGAFGSDALDNVSFRSEFIKKCIKIALTDSLEKVLSEQKSEWLILDAAEERIPKVMITDRAGSRICLAKHTFYHPYFDWVKQQEAYEIREIRFSALPWETVVERYTGFAEKMKRIYNEDHIIIVEVYLSGWLINKNYELERFDTENSGYSISYIDAVNEYLKRCYELLGKSFPKAKVIKLPPNCLCPFYHRWGQNPLHYTANVYEYLLECVRILTGKSNSDSMDALYGKLKMENYILAKMLDKDSHKEYS